MRVSLGLFTALFTALWVAWILSLVALLSGIQWAIMPVLGIPFPTVVGSWVCLDVWLDRRSDRHDP